MASSAPDQTALMKEVLDALQTLQMNQVQLASNVDAISGRVNVLAGMKEVRDVAIDPSSTPVKKIEPPSSADDSHHDDVMPESPSIPPTQLDGEASPSHVLHARKPSVTSRIILT
jgi:hypothetical protein